MEYKGDIGSVELSEKECYFFGKVQAVIFDLDGTLLNTLEDLADAVNAALEKNDFPARTIDEIRQFVGNGAANLIARAMPGGNKNTTTDDIADDEEKIALHEKILNEFREYYGTHCEEKTAPYEGVIPMLDCIRSMGIKLAVVSNKPDFAVKKLCRYYFGDRIDVANGENEVAGIGKKPSPEMVFDVLKKFDVDADECIYVGDSDVDIMTAENAGMPCISVLWGFRDREFLIEHGASVLTECPEEVCQMIRNGQII